MAFVIPFSTKHYFLIKIKIHMTLEIKDICSAIKMKAATRRWNQFLVGKDQNITSQLIAYLFPQKDAYIEVAKDWIIKVNKKHINAPSIYFYIGLDEDYKIEFYLVDSFSANSEDKSHILKCNFKLKLGINNCQFYTPLDQRTPQIDHVKAYHRYNEWNTKHKDWADDMLIANSVARVFTIPKIDFHEVLKTHETAYLFFALTTDHRPNQKDQKIEILISNTPPPVITPPVSPVPNPISKNEGDVNTPVYYNITTPYPPY
jgi:hypothetical protein